MAIKEKEYMSAFILAGFFTITILGLTSSSGPQFLHLIPHIFLVSAIVLVVNNKYQNTEHYIFYTILLILSYLIHWLLIKLEIHQLQPDYSQTLGLQLLNVPLVIPVLWFLLVNVVNGMLRKFPFNTFIAAFIGSTLILIIDLFLEAQATKFGFWSWKNGEIPFTNFIWWFAISFGFLFTSLQLNIRNNTFISTVIFVLMLMFLTVSDTIVFNI